MYAAEDLDKALADLKAGKVRPPFPHHFTMTIHQY
jgi:hypothetical protein